MLFYAIRDRKCIKRLYLLDRVGAPLRREAGDVVALFLVVELLCAAVALNLLEGGELAGEDVVDGALAGDVLNLSAREVEVGGQLTGIVGAEVLQHGAPYLALHLGGGLVELNLEEESTLEGTVEVARQVGGGDKNAIKVFNLLQDDVLHGIVHLVDGVLDVLRALVDEGIGLVEEEDGLHLTVATEVAIVLEDGLDVLLALTNILVAHAGDVHLHEVATSLTGYLQYGLGLSRARSSVEEAGKALAHALLLEALLDVGEVVCRK